ncbi:MAG: SLC13 family permease, partial [Planctomycetaceae bacterium]
MSMDAWITLAVVCVLFLGLVRDLAPPDLLFVAATSIFAVLGIITPNEAFAGFSNAGMLTVAFLFVVVAG